MDKIIVDIISVIFETFIVFTFFKSILKNNKLSKKNLSIFYLLFMATNSVFVLFINDTFLKLVLFFICCTLISVSYESRRTVHVFSIIFLILIISISEILVTLLLSIILEISIGIVLNNIIYYTTGMLLSKFFAFLIIKILCHNYQPTENPINLKWMLAIITFPIVTLFIGAVLIGTFGKNLNYKMGILGSVSMTLLVATNILIFYLFESYAKQLRSQSRIEFEKENLEREKKYFKDLIERQNNSNKVMHDLKNQLFAIRSKVIYNEDEAIKQINRICEIVLSKESIIYTENDSLNALINSKRTNMELNDIELKCINFMSNFKIDNMDLCIMIGNLLDNAIEACSKILGKKQIELVFKQLNNCLAIDVINPTSVNIDIQNGLIKTTKTDTNLHGIGLNSVRDIVNKYRGYIGLKCENYIFSVSIIIMDNDSITS